MGVIPKEKSLVLNGGNDVPPSREVPTAISNSENGSVADMEQIVIGLLTPVCIITEGVQNPMTDDYSTEIPGDGLIQTKFYS